MELNTSFPGQNDRHITENIFRCISVNDFFFILIKISMNFVANGPIGNKQALV